MNEYWTRLNDSGGYVSGKKTPSDTDNLFRLENIECLICTVTSIKMTKSNLTYFFFTLKLCRDTFMSKQ